MSAQENGASSVVRSRDVNEQLRIAGDAAEALLSNGKKPEIRILGINALGPLHQGMKTHRELLRSGAREGVLMLDPQSGAFKKRELDEDDQEGRLRAEMGAAFTQINNLERTRNNKGLLEVRFTPVYPDRSLILVNGIDEAGTRDYSKAVALYNPYPKTPGTRGMEGAMGEVTPRAPGEVFEENVKHFEGKWSTARTVRLPITDVFTAVKAPNK